MPVEAVIMIGPDEFRGEGPEGTGPGHTVRPPNSSLVVPQPANVTVQPARADAGSVAFDPIDWKPGRPLPDQERKIDTRTHCVLDCSSQPCINLHQQRAIIRVATEFHLANSLNTDRPG